MKVYALWLKHEYHNHVERFLDGIFTTYEMAKHRGAGIVKNYPTFYCDFEVETFILDKMK